MALACPPPTPLAAFPGPPDRVCRRGAGSAVFVYRPQGICLDGLAIKVYLPSAGDWRGPLAPKSTLPVADLERRGHLAVCQAFGPELYRERIVPLKPPGLVFRVDGCLHPKDLVSLKFRETEAGPDLMPAHALVFDYGGERLAADSAGADRRGLLRGLAALGATLAAFRRRGFAHLDVKDDNILVHRGRYRLADLGLFVSARAPCGSLLEGFLEDGRCYGLWPLDFYLASPRWRAAEALAGLEAAARALADAAPPGAAAPPALAAALFAAGEELGLQAATLLQADRCPGGLLRLVPPPLRELRAFRERGGLVRELCRTAAWFCEFVRDRAHNPPDLSSRDLASFQPYHAPLARFGEVAAPLGVELVWDGRADSLRRLAGGLRAACAAPGPRGALARFGSGVDVYMLGRLLLGLEAKAAFLPPGGVALACRMAALDPSRRPAAAEAAQALAGFAEAAEAEA